MYGYFEKNMCKHCTYCGGVCFILKMNIPVAAVKKGIQ
jgi:hypothetical protein